MNNKKANYWPHAIALSILGVFGLCVWTVKMTSENPVQMDSFYFDTYQSVDEDMNKILLQQKYFDKKYSVEIPRDNFKLDQENSIWLKLKDKVSNAGVNDANISVVITRPNTVEFDKHLDFILSKDGIYKFTTFEIRKPGRWQIMSKITVDGLTSFNKLEVNATK